MVLLCCRITLLIASSNGLAPFSPETLTALQEKHPPAPADLNLPLPPEEGIHQP